ncbi:glucuronate isomerase [Mobilitalea sibirica]|uniref:Uronate isomerase n=1 Tax=Mobilitalea sibirica TaxID=1462919 RepID=A0A8J7HAJ9_9FIRM|nr:glucuronate isomerase [Mobilitalea sibirica]MBH1941495.1 glucuronate isomerase [Mobilitalea sibirica]
MTSFMDKDFLLSTETAKQLYHSYAKQMPIIDYHCHIIPKEIAEDIRFENITQLWLGADHYKWRLMRANGVEERYITGEATDREKFQKWAQTLERAIGNPLYHWSHLELQRYFGYQNSLNSETAEEVWNLCNEKLKSPDMSAKKLIINSNVKVLCTTDDPIDTLEYHKAIAEDETFPATVLPAFRPDEAMNIEKAGFLTYLDKLSAISKVEITDFKSLCAAIKNRIEYFDSMGCKISDHGMEFVMYSPATEDEIEIIMKKRLQGQLPTRQEELQFKTAFLLYVGKEYHRLNWVMQLHYGVKRDNNTRYYKKIGINTGFDCIDDSNTSSASLADFLNALDVTDQLPKTILYSLNPTDNAAIDTVMGCFEDSSAIGKIQHGSAWWFNDHKAGMTDHMITLASLSLLSNFVGMLTDSRSFLSYTRHEYFRRILCDLIGKWVENGEYPKDMKILGKIVQDISYHNSMRYFEFQE